MATVNVPVVKMGAKDSTAGGTLPGSPVAFVQRNLAAHGFKGADGKLLTVDGDCGPNTVYAIKVMQKLYGLQVTGETNGETLATISRM